MEEVLMPQKARHNQREAAGFAEIKAQLDRIESDLSLLVKALI